MMADRTDIHSLLRLRILVLALGEVPELGWWKSKFMSPVGMNFLSRLYPRSDFAVAVRSTLRAAKPVHDTSIGIGRVAHLFRLPSDVERKLDRLLQVQQDEFFSMVSGALGKRDKLLEQASSLGDFARPESIAGPLRLGSLADVRRSDSVVRLAGAYYAAFQDGVKVYPYFEGESKRG